MTYLDAAEQVLQGAGQPLHYREITKRALTHGLLETTGKTPEAERRAGKWVLTERTAVA